MSTPNEIIGGKPHLTYLQLPSIGRGEIVKVFFADAGIEYDQTLIPLSEWPAHKAELIKSGKNLYGLVPVIELNGHVYTQSVPIIKFFSGKLGKYLGSSLEESYLLDKVADAYTDWRYTWVAALVGGEEDKKKHAERNKNCYPMLEAELGVNEGPFLLGDEVSYVDFCLYQVVHDDGLLKDGKAKLADWPNLKKLAEAMEKRPLLAEYLKVRPEA